MTIGILQHGIVTLVLISVISALQYEVDSTDTDYRLPKYWNPISYDIALNLDSESTTFSGVVNITYEVINEKFTDVVYLHADPNFINIDSLNIKLNNQDGCTFTSLENTSLLYVDCLAGVGTTNNFLYIEYNAKYSTEDGYGLVKSKYVNNGEEETILYSYFQPTYARRAFPCMDEPNFRSAFSLEISYPTEYNAISNSLVEDETNELSNNLQTTKFATTPRISPHLVSIFISKFQSSNIDDDNYDFKIFTRPEVVDFTNVGKKYYKDILYKLNDFHGTSYQDISDAECYHVAIPYYINTIQNFGLFTYSEKNLLDDGDKTPRKITQDIITTITNKLSQQWHGGDISTKWWSDIWVNEAISIYLQYMVADQVNSEMELKYQFVVEVVQKAMQYDALPFAKPLSSNENEIYLINDIKTKLDTYSIYKGASVLRMIGYLLGGEEDLKESLQYYINNRTKLDTDALTLLSELVESAGNDSGLIRFEGKENVYSYLQTWAFLPGFPLVTVYIQNITSDGEEVIKLAQKRFVYPVDNTTNTFISEYSADTTTNDGKWYIPISDTQSEDKEYNVTYYLFFEPNNDFTYYYGDISWIILNLQAGSFHRVNYDDTLWGRLISVLKTEISDIHVLNRAQLVDDIFNIARTGEVSYSLVFELSDYLVDETEYYPWYSAFNAFSYLIGKMEDNEAEENLKVYLLNLMEDVIDIPSGTYDDDTHINVLKNVMFLTWACQLGHSDCIDFTTEKFAAYKDNQNSMDDYNLRGLIFCNGIRYSDNLLDDWISLWSTYETSLSVHEKYDILSALGCIDDLILLQSYLEKLITTDSGIAKQDSLLVFNSILSGNSLGLEAILEFLENNFTFLADLYGNESASMLFKMFKAVAEKLIQDDHIARFKNILNDEMFIGQEDIITEIEVIISINTYWARNFRSDIKNILKQYA